MKGFEVISVSMDKNKIKAVKEDNVEAIPYVVILDENNKILGVKVRDAKITAILKDSLK